MMATHDEAVSAASFATGRSREVLAHDAAGTSAPRNLPGDGVDGSEAADRTAGLEQPEELTLVPLYTGLLEQGRVARFAIAPASAAERLSARPFLLVSTRTYNAAKLGAEIHRIRGTRRGSEVRFSTAKLPVGPYQLALAGPDGETPVSRWVAFAVAPPRALHNLTRALGALGIKIDVGQQ
jgi:hypothetical protein